MTALALGPVVTGRRPDSVTVPGPYRRSVAPGVADRAVKPCRPLHIPEAETRCPPARPTRAGCGTGVRATRPSVAVRRRRVVLGVVAAGLLAALALPWSGAGHSLAAGSGPVGGLAHHAAYVVEPGDTLWSIAQRLDPSGDPRPVVAQLAAEVGGDTVVPGEHVVLP